jgi:hypothetical protein
MLVFSGSYSNLYKAIFVVSLAVLLLAPLPADTLWLRELFNSGHSIVFFFITLILFEYVSIRLRGFHPVITFLVVLATAFMIGVFIEMTQGLLQREASVSDLGRNLYGIITGLCLAIYFRQKAWYYRLALVSVMLICLFLGGYSLIEISWNYYQRGKAFPLLTEFEKPWTKSFVRFNKAAFQGGVLKKNPLEASRFKFRFEPGLYPGVSIMEPEDNWSGYRSLHFDVFSTNIDNVKMVLRVHDKQHNQDYRDRFNRHFILQPGLNRIVVGLAEIRDAPYNRKIDMVNIAGIELFLIDVKEPLYLEVSNIVIQM